MKKLLLLAMSLTFAMPALAQNHAPNPYRAVPDVWGELPEGRTWGSTSAVYPAADGNIWVAERCGENTCVGHDGLDPILLFDVDGNLLRAFGAGMFEWPHGIHVDPDGNLWVTDARGGEGRGHQVHKFTPDGELMMSLGQAGVAGDGPDTFDQPSDVLVAPNGDIFVADGHGAGGNNRIVKFTSAGDFIMEWGATGSENGEFRDPHALAIDSRGRIFVGDRKNNRVQVFDQDGNHLDTWTQFGRPSGLFIDDNDVLYSADSESSTGGGIPNAGWVRGIRIGSVVDGLVTSFIPDPDWHVYVRGTTGAEGVAADAFGNIYGAEVGPRMLRKYMRVR